MTITNLSRLFAFCIIVSIIIVFSKCSTVDIGKHQDPLILTQYLKSGQIETARELAKVKNSPFPKSVISYSGFFTVNATHDSNIFFWFFPPQEVIEPPRLLLWLNGGPGSSSQFGLFVENGPFIVNETNIKHFRTTSWTKETKPPSENTLFMDKGECCSVCGQSGWHCFTRDGYATSMPDVIEGLYSTLCQFFEMFPEYRKAKFFITGESFAGQYIPHLAIRVLEQNTKFLQQSQHYPSCDISLHGVSIGNGFIDPKNSLEYSEFLYNLGLLDKNGHLLAKKWQDEISTLIHNQKYVEAFQVFDRFIGYSGLKGSLISNLTGSDFYYNVLIPKRPLDYDYYTKFVEQPEVRMTLHVGTRHHFQDGDIVMKKMEGEIMKSAKDAFHKLVTEHTTIPVLLYNGQLDLIVANRLTESFLEALKLEEGPERIQWSARKIFKKSPSQIVGYYKTWKRFSHMLVRDCGHMVPYDQPEWGYFLITSFLKGELTDNNTQQGVGSKKYLLKTTKKNTKFYDF